MNRSSPNAIQAHSRPDEPPAHPVVQQPLWEIVAERLQADILGGVLAEGARLREVELATRFGVSRGPIREALRELARLGLAVEMPRRGTFVSSATELHIQEVYVAREAIEIAAGRELIVRAHDEELLRLRDLVERVEEAYLSGDRPTGRALDMEFHRAVCVLAGNNHLLRFFDQLAAQTVLLLRAEDEQGPVESRVPPAGLHRDIAEALGARDEGRMRKAITAHFSDRSNWPIWEG